MNRKAFTPIELLVVVLIIGILAAIALLKYEKAVRKTRVAALLPTLRAVWNAERVVRLETDNPTRDALGIEIPTIGLSGWTGPTTIFRSCTKQDTGGCQSGVGIFSVGVS